MITPKQFLKQKVQKKLQLIDNKEKLQLIEIIDRLLLRGLLDIYCSPFIKQSLWDDVLKEYEKIGWEIKRVNPCTVSFKFKNDKNTQAALAESESSEQTPE